jgi:hypothetical protein
MAEKGVHSLGLYGMNRRELVYFGFLCVLRSLERLSADWFGKLSDTLKLFSWIHSPGSRVTLPLRLGTTMSMVGWNVLGLQPIDDSFH